MIDTDHEDFLAFVKHKYPEDYGDIREFLAGNRFSTDEIVFMGSKLKTKSEAEDFMNLHLEQLALAAKVTTYRFEYLDAIE